MALVLADRVRDTTTTTGTGTVTLSGTAPTGYQNFSVIGNANTTYYTINAGSQWEVGIGTYSSTGPTLARTTVLESSNANALVNFSAGTKDVFVTYPSDEAVYQDGAVIAAGTAVLGVTNGGTGVTTSTGTGSVVLSASPTFTGTVNVTNLTASATLSTSGVLSTSSFATVSLIATGTIIIGATNATNSITLGRSTATQTTSIQAGATTSGNTKTINLGTGGLAGSTTTITIGSTAGTSTTTLNGAVSFAGTIAAPLGSAAAPSYTFTGDTNTGVFSPGADTIAFSEGGVEAMRIDSSGNVGIGTTAPDRKLDVQGSGSITVRSRSTDTSGVTVGILAAEHASGSSLQVRAGVGFTNLISTGAADPLILSTNSAERMRITSAGNVGIGVSSPAGRLALAGTGSGSTSPEISFENQTATTGRTYAIISGDGGPLRFQDVTAGAERMRIASDGNVGIGTTSPGAKLDVSSSTFNIVASRSTGGYAAFQRFAASGQQAYDFYNINGVEAGRITVDGSNFMAFATGSAAAERMRIDSSGNVGVGTTTPLARLFAQAPTGAGAVFSYIGNANGAYPSDVFGGSFGYNFSAGGAEVDFWNGWTGASGTQGGFAFRRQTGASSQNLLMTIRGDGNVGIGESGPGAKLDVFGGTVGTTAGNLLNVTYAGGLAGGNAVGIRTRLVRASNGTDWTTTAMRLQGRVDASNFGYIDLVTNGAQGIAFGSDTSERMRIDSAGNVGIGTSAPAQTLHVNGNALLGGSPAAQYSSVTISGDAAIQSATPLLNFVNAAGSTRFGYLYHTGSGGNIELLNQQAGAMLFGTNNTERVRITSAGNVGIGTTSPGAKLDVLGISLARTDASGGNSPLVAKNDNTGNNTTKTTGLLFQGVDTVGTGKNTGVVQCGPSDANYVTSYLAFQTRTADALAERMRITDTGNVGIGTSSPGSFKLNVQGNAYATTTAVGADENLIYQAASNTLGFRVGTSTNQSYFNIKAVSGVPQLDGAGGVLALGTAGTERARINGSGEFLTGTTTGGRAVCMFASDMWLRLSNASRSYLIGPSIGSNFNIFDETGGYTVANFDTAGSFNLRNSIDIGSGVNLDNKIQIGAGRTGSNYAYIDLIGDTTYTDYGLRLIRGNGGANTTSQLVHRGTGDIYITTQDAAPMYFQTNSTTRMYIEAGGTVQMSGSLLVGRSSASTDVNTANDTGSFSVRGSTTTIASMSFHRTGAYAINMGLGTDNVFRIGGWSASSNCFQMDGSGNLTMLGNVTAYSDARIKKDVETIDSALDLVSKMRGVRYTRIDTKKRGVGVIAQEMLEVCPEVVQQGVGDDDTLSVAYGNLVGVLIEAVKELTARVAELEGK